MNKCIICFGYSYQIYLIFVRSSFYTDIFWGVIYCEGIISFLY